MNSDWEGLMRGMRQRADFVVIFMHIAPAVCRHRAHPQAACAVDA